LEALYLPLFFFAIPPSNAALRTQGTKSALSLLSSRYIRISHLHAAAVRDIKLFAYRVHSDDALDP